MIQDNLQADKWHEEKDWSDELGQEKIYYPTDDHELYQDGNGKAKMSFTDVGGTEFKKSGISESDWQYKFICGDEKWAKPSYVLKQTNLFILLRSWSPRSQS